MMPKLICKNCGHEFWGWGLYHSGKDGERECPDCGGLLYESTKQRTEAATELIGETTAA